MDSDRFDIWTKLLTADSASRRGAVRAIAGALLSGGLAFPGLEATAAGCVKPNKTGCKGPANRKCCRGATCKGGSKRKAGTCVCRRGLTKCGTSCVNTSTARRHCGSCGNGCAGDATCIKGTCVIGQGTCSTGADSCGSVERCDSASSVCACYQSASGQTRCGSVNSLFGPCGECTIDADCATKYPDVAGVFCMAESAGCVCAGQRRCKAPCTD